MCGIVGFGFRTVTVGHRPPGSVRTGNGDTFDAPRVDGSGVSGKGFHAEFFAGHGENPHLSAVIFGHVTQVAVLTESGTLGKRDKHHLVESRGFGCLADHEIVGQFGIRTPYDVGGRAYGFDAGLDAADNVAGIPRRSGCRVVDHIDSLENVIRIVLGAFGKSGVAEVQKIVGVSDDELPLDIAARFVSRQYADDVTVT